MERSNKTTVRRLMGDVYDKTKWKPCRLVKNVVTASVWVTGAIYVNLRDASRTKSTQETPILIKDSEGVLWTESVADFKKHYVRYGGGKITDEFLYSRSSGEDFKVVTNTEKSWYAFHVTPDFYGFNCPLGANKSEVYSGDGDYLVTDQIDKISLESIRVVRTETFKVQYKTKEEAMKVFEFKNSVWRWDDRDYPDLDAAETALCNDIAESSRSLDPKFGPLSIFTDRKIQLLWAIFNQNDMESYLSAVTANQFAMMTRHDFGPTVKGLGSNQLCGRFFRIPMTYESNRVMQCALLPKLEEIYNECKCPIETKVGKFSFEKVFSFICDTVLFSYEDSPFKKWLEVLGTLDDFMPTKDLSSTLSHEDLPRLRILAMQVKAGDIPVDAEISIGDVRACRYSSKTRDELGDMDYVDAMLCSPPAVQSDDFYGWLGKIYDVKHAVEKEEQEHPIIEEKGPELVIEKPSVEVVTEEQVKSDTEESMAETLAVESSQAEPVAVKDYFPMNPPEDVNNENMYCVAQVYCNVAGSDVDVCRTVLQSMGIETWEDFYRALPIYLRRTGKGVYESALIEYCNILGQYYGSCELRLNA